MIDPLDAPSPTFPRRPGEGEPSADFIPLPRSPGEGWEGVSLPLWDSADANRLIAWRAGKGIPLREFASHVAAIGERLPAGSAMINLCDDRYHFLAAYAAALAAGHPVLLPAARAEQVICEVERSYDGSYRSDDMLVAAAIAASHRASSDGTISRNISGDQVAFVAFTSGSTGKPKAFPKLWSGLARSNAHNAATMRGVLGAGAETPLSIVATVPPQHMFGMELSILLPLLSGMAVHSARPLFPADVAGALAEIPEPRVLVSTPVHLRALIDSRQEFPLTALIVSATAPLDAALATAVERRLGGQLLELFGSTETGVIAHRRTASALWWQLHQGAEMQPTPDGTMVNAPWFAAPTLLQDIVELNGSDRFMVRGRNADLIEVAGKRASLADLTRRVQAIEGVKDAVVFQPESEAVGTIRRVAALVVAPGLMARQIIERLAPSIDAAFIPRPLLIVDELPRNELGKLPREMLLEALRIKRGEQ